MPSFSLAMHGKHARVSPRPGCYDCHPGPVTQCLRTAIEGMQSCENCHGNLQEMATSLRNGRRPWLDEPKCSNCHQGLEIDTGSTLYRDARGHHGVYCATCHYEPHAWWPSLLPKDNRQAILLQGESGPLGKNCLACHTSLPDEPGPHGLPPSSTAEVVNLAPSSPLEGRRFLGPPVTSSSQAHLSMPRRGKMVLIPELLVPEDRIGERVSLYYLVCSADHSWCSDVRSLGRVTLGHTVLFPIIETPTPLSGIPAGTYRIYVGFSRVPDFSDLVYSFYEVKLD
ncbi:cytochrome c3 family protein [Thermosulfurimonas sp. F29]|uniref:cytochrome c3 family protein n=1 Tax=Thermosulfurimonas sp. F29 TaxID=2867247 RepID=UPI001C83A134|nr:cytochrome c3 family protein [Thermosulfurimonas sp. F29]MBX6424275.1 cytochrome c3 family protein [Thermosulfurimonas sp. F29]